MLHKRETWPVACYDPAGPYLLIRPIRGFASGQGVVFDRSVLDRVHNFMRAYPNFKQDEICFCSTPSIQKQ